MTMHPQPCRRTEANDQHPRGRVDSWRVCVRSRPNHFQNPAAASRCQRLARLASFDESARGNFRHARRGPTEKHAAATSGEQCGTKPCRRRAPAGGVATCATRSQAGTIGKHQRRILIRDAQSARCWNSTDTFVTTYRHAPPGVTAAPKQNWSTASRIDGDVHSE